MRAHSRLPSPARAAAAGLLVLGLALPRAEAEKFLDAVGGDEKQILSDLHQGKIVEAKPFGANDNTGSVWKVVVEHQGRRRTAVFKPRAYGDRDGWARTPMEVATYKLDRILGLGLVPPVAYRRGVKLQGKHFHEGALMLWVEGAHHWARVPEQKWHPRREVFSSDLRVLQAIVRDADNQNGKNIIRARHWRDGRWRLMKVDNEASMREGAYVHLEHHLPTWNEVRRFRKRTYQRLKELNFHDLEADVGEFMSDGEIRDWLATRDRLVEKIDRMKREREDVFFSEEELAFDSRQRLGERASRRLRDKFGRKMKQKGVRVTYLDPSDRRLRGAQGKTVLRRDGIRVYLARGVTRATLTEELVHVNQLRRMARRAGGYAELHRRMSSNKARARLLPLSMEVYAKGRVASTLRGRDRREARKAQARYRRRLRAAGVRGERARTLWNQRSRAKKRSPRARTGRRGRTPRARAR